MSTLFLARPFCKRASALGVSLHLAYLLSPAKSSPAAQLQVTNKMKHWTTEEQQAWIEERAPAFVQAQKDSNVGPYMSLFTHEWFEAFPDTMPESVTVKELFKAGDNLERALIEKKKNVSWKVASIFWFGTYSFRTATSKLSLQLFAREKGEEHEGYQLHETEAPWASASVPVLSANVSFDAAEREI